jgi:hypothetical protein
MSPPFLRGRRQKVLFKKNSLIIKIDSKPYYYSSMLTYKAQLKLPRGSLEKADDLR